MSKVPESRSGGNGSAPEPKGPRSGKAGPSASSASRRTPRSTPRSAGGDTGKGAGTPGGKSGKGTGKSTGGAKKNAKADPAKASTTTRAGSAGRSPKTRSGDGSPPAGQGLSRPTLTSRAAILALVVCAITLSLAYPLREYALQRAEIAKLQEKRVRTEQSVSELEQRHEQLQNPNYIEREARDRLHYQYPGERAYVILSEDEDARAETTEDNEPWFTRLWRSVQEADEAVEPVEEIPEAQPPER